MLGIYNSLSKRVETFRPRSGREVKLYTCGPTVYSRPHLGNYRTYLWEDELKRYLLYRGYSVRHVMNITDFDNTIIREVKKTGIPRRELTAKYERLFRQDLRALGVIPAGKYPHASAYAREMRAVVRRLLAKKLAYRDGKGRIFFDVSRYPSYGRLVGRRLSRTSRRVTREEYLPGKAGDFLVWSPCHGHECRCSESEHGRAQPPWNIQCAAMSSSILGQVDISMGGRDNLFNHHENTRAIAGSLLGHEPAKYWMHVRHLMVDGRKMSKSKGNAILLPDAAAKGFSPKLVRFILLSRHYRGRLNFTWAYAGKMKARYARLADAIAKLGKANGKGNPRLANLLAASRLGFEKSMDDDLDVPQALVAVGKFAAACGKAGLSQKQSSQALALLKKFDSVLACLPL